MADYIITPSSSGSKGDEGMIRGALNLIGNQATVITQDFRYLSWRAAIPERIISESVVPLGDMKTVIGSPGTLYILGADVIDGLYGLESTISRLKAATKMCQLGGDVHIFSSFRSEVDTEVITYIQKLSNEHDGQVHWHLRDPLSLEHFKIQTGVECDFFPDFAFYCETQGSAYTMQLKTKLEDIKREGRTVIGIGLCQHAFNSLFTDNTRENLRRYVEDVLRACKDTCNDPHIVLLSNDTREWDGHISDFEFAREASTTGLLDCTLVDPSITYPEMTDILRSVDIVITGRMHLAIAAFKSRSIPIMYTGDGSRPGYNAIDKCRGMFTLCYGSVDNVASRPDSLRETIRKVNQNRESVLRIINEHMDILEDTKIKRAGELFGIKEILCTSPTGVPDVVRILNDENIAYIKQLHRRIDDLQRRVDDLSQQLNNVQRYTIYPLIKKLRSKKE